MLPVLQHVLTPGDHYSPATGSAVVTVVHGLASAHAAAGGRSTVLVSRDTYADRYADAEVVQYARTAGLPSRRERWIDAVRGAVGRPRDAWRRPWVPAAAELRTDGVALVHNGPQVGSMLPDGAQRVLYVHNSLLRTYTPWEARRALRSFDHVVTVSRFLADELQRRAGGGTPVSVVPNGVDPAVFFPAERREAGPVRVLFLGRVIPQKGAHLLVEALLSLQHLSFELDVVGNSGFSATLPLTVYEKQLRWAAEPLGDRARFSPFVPRTAVPALMRNADLVVVPSIVREGTPLTLLEGMATGAACVGVDAGGMPETAGAAARLFPRKDTRALTALLEELLTDDDARSRVGRACRERASTFTWEASHAGLLESLAR